MHIETLTRIYIWGSWVPAVGLAIIWNKKDILNFFVKLFFTAQAFLGAAILYHAWVN